MRTLFFGLFLLVVVLTTLTTRSALADEAAARAHFKRGIELYDRKQYAEALFAFQDAYREKPSAGIKQNIALSLKGLGRTAEAATAFDEALDEGKDTLKPETRAAIERELAELSNSVATMNIKAVSESSAGARAPVPGVVVTVVPDASGMKPQTLLADALRRPVRLAPGVYTFTAHASGFADPPEKKLALVTGAPVDATFVMRPPGASTEPVGVLGPNEGMLRVQTNVPESVVKIDGVELPQKGAWSGKVKAGAHKIELSAPGWRTTTLDVTVAAGATVEQPVKLMAAAEVPPEFVAPAAKPVKEKTFNLAATLDLDTTSYRLGPVLGEPTSSGTRRSNFVGISIGLRFGYKVAKTIALEADLESGGMAANYKIHPSDALDTKTTVEHLQAAPMVRFVGEGKARFTAAAGVGVQNLTATSKIAETGSTLTKKASGAGVAWLGEAGMQVDVGAVFLEIAAFLNVHSVAHVDDHDAPNARALYASPATRGGLRLGLGLPF